MKGIDVLFYKFDSSGNKAIIEDILKFSSRSIIISHNGKKLWVEYQPEGCNIKGFRCLFTFGNEKIDYLAKPILYVFAHIKLCTFFLWVILKYKVKIVYVEGIFLAAFIGILRRLKLVKKSIYHSADWLVGSKTKFGIWSNIGNNLVFPISDYFAARLNDVTLNPTLELGESRRKYWGKPVVNKEYVFQGRMKILRTSPVKILGKKILFLGTVRPDSGLEIAIAGLSLLKRPFEFSVKIIGVSNDYHLYLKRLAKEEGVENRVEYLGFVDREKFSEYMADCFCGINLITAKDSFTAKTIPAKILDYFEHLLPVIVTEHTGPLAKTIKENKLGVVVNPTKEEFVKAARYIYQNNLKYQENIIKFIKSFRTTEVETILKID